jgi:uncharacterized protein YybS (DUF2232 family)
MENSLRQSNGVQTIAAVLIGTVGSGLLFSASLAVPLVGFVSAFLAPVPLGLARIKSGSGAAGFTALLTTLLMALLFSPPVGAWYAVQCGLIGLVVPELMLKGMNPFRTILWSTALAVLLTAVIVTAFSISTGTNPQVFAQKEISDGINQAVKLYEKQSGLSAQDLETLRGGMQNIGRLMSLIYPALVSINLGLISAACLLFCHRIADRYSLTSSRVSFREFRTPASLIWLLIIAGFFMLIAVPLVTTPALNVLVVLGVLYFMQGLAVLLTFCARTKFNGTLKVLLTIILVTQPYLTVIVAVIGIFDYWGEFRTPRTTQGENL